MHLALAAATLTLLAGLPAVLSAMLQPPPPRPGARPASANSLEGDGEEDGGEGGGGGEDDAGELGDVFHHMDTAAVLKELGDTQHKLQEKIDAYDALMRDKSEENISSKEEELSVLRDDILRSWQLFMEYYECAFQRMKGESQAKGKDIEAGLVRMAKARSQAYDTIKAYLPEETLKSPSIPELVDEFSPKYEELKDLIQEIDENDQKYEKVDGLMHLESEMMGRVRDAWQACALSLNTIHSALWKMAGSMTDQSVLEKIRSQLDHFTNVRDKLFAQLESKIDGIKDGIPIDEFTSEEKVESLKSHPHNYRTMMILRAMVESPASEDLFKWSDDGTSVLISSASDEEFKELFASFGMSAPERHRVSRILKDWGFVGDLNSGRFSHPLFTRGNPFDIRRMRCATKTDRIPAHVRSKGGCKASVDGKKCGKQCIYDAADSSYKPTKPAVEYHHCATHIGLDEKCFAGVPPDEIAAFDAEVKEKIDRSRSKLEEKAQMLDERKEKVKHRTCGEIIEEDTEFIDAWREEANSFASGGYSCSLDEVTMKHSGYRHDQLVHEDQWNASEMSTPRRGQLIFHRMMLVNGICCGVCHEPVVGRDENGNVRKDWSDPKAFYKYHLHHRTKKMSTPGYIVPSALPSRSLYFDKRMWHYSDLQVLCNHDHEQGESRIHWEVDRSYQNKIGYDDVPSKHVPIANVLKGDKWAAFKTAVEDYKLDTASYIPHVSKKELDVIIFNATGYLPSDLATWANKDLPWERRGYRALGPRMIKTLALNFIKKECGVCLGRDGVKCTNKDIRNETPQRMSGYHGDHGENAVIKEWNPSELVTKSWAEFEAELMKLEGFRCGCCHRNL